MAVPKKRTSISKKRILKKKLEKEGILDIVESDFPKEIAFYR